MIRFIKGNIHLLAVSWGHFVNDFFMSLVPVTMFAFATELKLNATEMSAILFVIMTAGTFFQPIVGMLIDRVQKSILLIYGLIAITIGMSLSGFITNFYLLGIVVGISALGSSIYHPLGSTITIHKTNLSRGKSLSIFMTVGGFAATAAPLIAIPLVTRYGLKSLIIFIIPGLLSALFLYMTKVQDVKWTDDKKVETEGRGGWKSLTKRQQFNLSIPMMISIVLKSLYSAVVLFGVIIMKEKGVSVVQAGIILSVFMFSRAIATLIGGFVSDYIGEKKTIIFFNGLTFLGLLLFVYSSGILMAIGLVVSGFASTGGAAAGITITHRIAPNHMNYATGLIMGFSATISAVLMLGYGRIVDVFGQSWALNVLVILMGLIVVLAALIPKEFESNTSTVAINEIV